MYAEERQHEIVTRAREMGRVAVAELAARYDVTAETIRRDLDALAAKGRLSRVYGGAVPAEKLRLTEAPMPARQVAATTEKQAIAQRAVELLPQRDGLTVLLDGGTTTGRLATLLPPSVSLVVTNSVPTALQLSEREGPEVWLLGGQVRGITQAVVGASAIDTLTRLRVDVAFLGTNGFSVEHGFSTPDAHEAAVKRAMVACAREVAVLSDASKHDSDHLISFAGLDDVDALVTDRALAPAAVAALRTAGLRVELA